MVWDCAEVITDVMMAFSMAKIVDDDLLEAGRERNARRFGRGCSTSPHWKALMLRAVSLMDCPLQQARLQVNIPQSSLTCVKNFREGAQSRDLCSCHKQFGKQKPSSRFLIAGCLC